jgi:hypothetical protein
VEKKRKYTDLLVSILTEFLSVNDDYPCIRAIPYARQKRAPRWFTPASSWRTVAPFQPWKYEVLRQVGGFPRECRGGDAGTAATPGKSLGRGIFF